MASFDSSERPHQLYRCCVKRTSSYEKGVAPKRDGEEKEEIWKGKTAKCEEEGWKDEYENGRKFFYNASSFFCMTNHME